MDERTGRPEEVAASIMELAIGTRREAFSVHLLWSRDPDLDDDARKQALDWNARLVTALRELAERRGVRPPWAIR